MHHHLPEDIVYEILVRVPTKPLLRFKCLSKRWKHLISDYFKSRPRHMILMPFEPLQAIDNTVPGDRTVHSVSELPSSFMSKDQVIIAGAVDGIVLLVLKDMILYNPVTGAFKIVPDPPFESSNKSRDAYGFGYGTTPDDLKIVRIRYDGNGFYQASRWYDVFSFTKGSWSTNSWTLGGGCFIKQCAGTFLNGFLYWIADRGTRSLIVALDVKEMVFSEIRLPSSACLHCLGTSGGRLHGFRVTISKFELWVMDKDNSEKPWWKVVISNGLANVYPLSILDEGKIVLLEARQRNQVIIYDMLKDSYEEYVVNTSVGKARILQAMQYVESLISPAALCSTW